jgi:hypothetical protein
VCIGIKSVARAKQHELNKLVSIKHCVLDVAIGLAPVREESRGATRPNLLVIFGKATISENALIEEFPDRGAHQSTRLTRERLAIVTLTSGSSVIHPWVPSAL